MTRVTRFGVLEIVVAFLITVLCLWYVYLNPAYDLGTFLIGVALPAVLGSALLLAGRQRVLLFVFLAYFWSLVDDAPVNFDSVLTWPQVTHYQPIVPHFEDYILLGVVAFFFYLAAREYLKGRRITTFQKARVGFLTLVAFGLSYLQDAEIEPIHELIVRHWYQVDLLEHIASAAVLCFALWVGSRSRSRAECPVNRKSVVEDA